MHGSHNRSSEFGPDWLYQQRRRSRGGVAARRPAMQGVTLVWLIMFACVAGAVGVSGQAALKSLDRTNQSLAQAFHIR